MSVIAASVEQIGVPTPNSAEYTANCFPRVFDYNGAIYMADFRNTAPMSIAQTNIGLYSTTDGVTITALDTANAPICQRFAMFYPRSGGNKVYFAYNVFGVPDLNLIDFDLDTGLFGTPITGGPVIATSSQTFSLVVRSDGTYIIGYRDQATPYVMWVKYDGSWSSPVQVSEAGDTGNTPNFASIGINPSDETIILYCTIIAGSYKLTSKTLSAADVLTSAFVSVASMGTMFGVTIPIGFCEIVYNPSLDEWDYIYGDGNTSFVNLLRISPSANPNTASSTAICANDEGESFFGIWLGINNAGTKLYFADVLFAPAGSTNLAIQYRTQNVGGSSWSVPVILFDARSDTLGPPFDTVDPLGGCGFPSLGILSDNSVAVQFFEDLSSPTRVETMFFVGSIGPALSLACPVGGSTGLLGVPYSKTLVVTGGTGPFTFAIIGGSLPPGLTLNTSTGEIHGTPTAVGTYDYTAQVTDSLDATATADCEIVISGPSLACPAAGGTATIGSAYSKTLVASGGTAPYTYAIVSGSLPLGLTLDSATGTISGTPTLPTGTFTYTAEVTDADGAKARTTCSIVLRTSSGGCIQHSLI